MINQDALQEILGIKEKVYVNPIDMANHMNVTFFPYDVNKVSSEIMHFAEKLEQTFKELNVNIIPFEESLTKVPISKVLKSVLKMCINNIIYLFRKTFRLPQKNHFLNFLAIFYLFNRTKVKKGISIITLGEQTSNNLPIKYIYSFKHNSVITILDFPKNISERSTFNEHFDTALYLFSYHMTNIAIGVDNEKWILYNLNVSHPIFSLDKDFKKNVLHALIPKVVAPIRPYLLSEFIMSKEHFDINDIQHKKIVEDLVKGAFDFSKTSLYPHGVKIDDLPFRNNFFKWIGKLHLDNRNGMSYGFLAIQMPGTISPLLSIPEFEKMLGFKTNESHIFYNNKLYVKLDLKGISYWIKVPDVWVLSQKSGSDKTHVNPERDLIKLGLSNGKMIIETQNGSVIDNDYKTSFDTQVILAHSVGNAIIASVLAVFNPDSEFLKRYLTKGISISHWHGYIHPDNIVKGWYVHGVENPHVACSSPQSALYAISGKLKSFEESLKGNIEYKGDIHIEPHHGTNICYTSITDLAEYFIKNPKASVLGNSYYYLYNK